MAFVFVAGCHSASSSRIAFKAKGKTPYKGRQYIVTSSITVEMWDLENLQEKVNKIVKSFDGLVMDSTLEGESSASFEIQIPADKLSDAMDQFAALGSETSRDVTRKDVTDQAIDWEAKLKNKKELRDRLLKLLKKTQKVTEVLAVEKELSRIQTEIDSIEGRLKKLKNDIAMSTLSVNIKKRRILGPLGYLFKYTFWGIGKLFVIQN
jgi:chromosome segregation ATPase